MTSGTAARSFPSPYAVPVPAGAENWRAMYPSYLLFQEENRGRDEKLFWFLDSLHRPEVEYPFDTIVHEAWVIAANAFARRVFLLPASDGFIERVVNGRLYTTALIQSDPAEMEARAPIFGKRAAFYFENWDPLFRSWKEKMEACIDELRALEVPRLPDVEDERLIDEHPGTTTGYDLLGAYDRVIQNVFRAYQYHFEMHLCGYGAYLNLFQFCQAAFPDIPEQTIANMVAGSDIMMFRPGDELKRLAKMAVELGIADHLRKQARPETIIEELRSEPNGRRWAESLQGSLYPWFYFSIGTGLYHHERSWIDDLAVPWGMLQAELERLEQGQDVQRPRAEILERRERLVSEYRDLLSTDEDRETFDQNIKLARMVAPYVEDHNFYIENWHHTVFWNKLREFGQRMVDGGILEAPDDLFYLNRWDVAQALYDLVLGWSNGGATSTGLWKRKVKEHKSMLAVLQEWAPEPALGPIPPEINEPFTIMLWGITRERVEQWLEGGEEDGKELHGVPGAPGTAEGPARVILSVDQLPTVQQGEVLVCPVTAPTWGPAFSKIKAAVVDTGGVMSHAAIVCREYGLPAVVGTVHGTKRLRTGDRVRVDGGTGLVSILS
ncbi:MAG: PEP-utilizing protein mobile subunit [Candidatus Dormibacteraeota bacterium]|nr:PEP-utilizing protein mobile subunit [Candidatus Dormibacteraeota bacterium]